MIIKIVHRGKLFAVLEMSKQGLGGETSQER